MRFKTTAFLLAAVCVLGVVYWVVTVRDGFRYAASARLPINPAHVQALTLDKEDSYVECVWTNGIWRMVSPFQAQADTGQMDRMLSALDEIRVRAVVTEDDRHGLGLSLHDYGLERPQARIHWMDEGRQYTLLIGREAPLGDALYVQMQGDPDVLAVPRRLLDIWPESALALRDRLLFHGDARRVNRFEIRRAGGFLQVQRSDEGGWHIQQPVVAHADAAAVRQWLDRVFEWRVVDFVADAVADATVYGLDEAAIQITVWLEGQNAGQSIWLGRSNDSLDDVVYARRKDGQSVFTVPASVLESARIRPNDIRDRTLIPLTPAAITRVSIKQGHEDMVWTREVSGWRVHSPERWPADEERINAFLDQWTSVHITDFVDEPAVIEETATDSFRIRFDTLAVEPAAANPRERSVIITAQNPPLPGEPLRVRRNSEPYLYEIDGSDPRLLRFDPLYYRHRRVLDVAPTNVVRIEQRVGSQHHQLARNAQGEFALIAEPLLQRLTRLQADEFLMDRPEDWALYGLDEPPVVWTLGLTPEAGIGRILMLGDRAPDGRVYARTLGHDLLFVLDEETADWLMRPMTEATPSASAAANDEEGN
jgi:hypothetical protein